MSAGNPSLRFIVLAVFASAAWADDCPRPADMKQAHMLGLWRAEFHGEPPATLELGKHPRYAVSLKGSITRGREIRPVVGDIEAGDLTLEESADGVRISATWLGEVVDGSCGREIRGDWHAEGEPRPKRFVLRKL